MKPSTIAPQKNPLKNPNLRRELLKALKENKSKKIQNQPYEKTQTVETAAKFEKEGHRWVADRSLPKAPHRGQKDCN